jgi:ATP-binding cassette, subfamily C (CFTR/MRP), member 4
MNRGKIVQIDIYHNCCNLSREALKTDNIHIESSHHAFEGKVEKSYASHDSKENVRDNKTSDSNKEEKSTGEVSGDTWNDYIQALGGRYVVAGLLLLFAFTQCALIMTIVTIGRWAEKRSELQSSPEIFMLVLTLGVVVIFLSFWRSWLAFSLTLKASQKLHDAMTLAVLRAKIEFFDTNPLGRILNRFSADIGIMDDQLPVSLNDTVSIGFLIIGAIATAASVLPFILIAVPPIAYYFIRIRRMFMAASRELKRYEGMARSPLYGMMSETIMGITSIRVNGAKKYFQDRFSRSQNAHSRAFFSYIACTRWLNFRLETIQLCLLSIASFLAVFFHTQNVFNVDPAVLGLSLSLLLQLSGLLQWAVRQSCDVISHMVAVERVASYGKVTSESPLETEADDLLHETWPSEGSIDIKNLSVRYQKQLPPSLSGLNFHSKGGVRIGIVGRTGSGKSTFLHAFLRLLEAEEGKIAIDQEDLSKLGLHKIRKLISVIPQTPFLFSGWTLRDNLDPFKKHSDKEIMQSIINVQLENLLQECPHGLNTIVNDSGCNFSVGQCQLLCVARAILQKNRILFLDEATANVDPQTEDLLSAAVTTSFPGATIISIAHRLETIIDYDLILVIEKGKIIESGSPSELLMRTGSFAAMVEDTGPSVSVSLRHRAQNVSSTYA